MNRIILTALLLLTFSNSHAFELNLEPLKDKWYIASNVAMLADYSTTLGIGRSNGEYVESAPLTRKIIGENPSTGRVQKYFVGRILLSTAVQYLAPPEYSRYLMQIQSIVHFSAAAHNYNIGLKFQF